MMLKILSLKFIFILSTLVLIRQSNASTNQLALSQGVSSPSMTNVALFSNGFTQENPVALSYQSGYRSSASLDGGNSTSFGLDLGLGDTQYGLALGAYSNGCDGCEAYVRGALSALWGSFGLGFGVQDGLYTMGLLYNPNGLHRVGLVVDIENNNGFDNAGVRYGRTAFGLGYSLVLPQFTFSLDLSKQSYSNVLRTDGGLMVSPAVGVRIDMFAVSLSYDMFVSDSTNTFANQVWVGIGANITSEIQLTFYGDYIDRWTLMGSYYF